MGPAHGVARACPPPLRPGSVVARCILVAGLLAALFVMHGLTAEHHLPMPPMATGAAVPGGTTPHTTHVTVDRPAPAPIWVHASSDSPGGHTGMGAVCVAVLSAACLAGLALLKALRVLRSSRTPTGPPASAARPAATRSLPRPPDLAALCVLRT